jgi:hypothetical protein
MPQPKGTIAVDILADGTIRAETGDMGGVAHKAADDFLKYLAELLGGTVTDAKVERGHQHHHDHRHGDTDHHHSH